MLAKHRRGPWSSAEDQCLMELVRTQGASNWVRIAGLIQSRSPKQCRERYHQNLKPSLNLDPITPEEGVLIERMVAEMGKRWAEIARRLHGRSDNAVKNWWNGGMNRRKRRDNRRAEMTSGPHGSTTHRVHQTAAPLHSLTVPQQHYDPLFSAHQQRYESAHIPSSLPPPTQNYQPPTRYLQHPRSMAEPPIPSPSAVSFVSRTDSSDNGPPSLVSDVSSASSYSQSPTTQYPPSDSVTSYDYRDSYRRPIQSGLHLTSHYDSYPTPNSNIHLTGYPTSSKEYFHSQSSYHLPTESWRDRPSVTSEPPNKSLSLQKPLPSFSSVTAGDMKMAEPSSPPKDDRMKVNALIH